MDIHNKKRLQKMYDGNSVRKKTNAKPFRSLYIEGGYFTKYPDQDDIFEAINTPGTKVYI